MYGEVLCGLAKYTSDLQRFLELIGLDWMRKRRLPDVEGFSAGRVVRAAGCVN